MNELEQYLRDAVNENTIDFHIRARVDVAGRVRFYIHPQYVGGETKSFVFVGEKLIASS